MPSKVCASIELPSFPWRFLVQGRFPLPTGGFVSAQAAAGGQAKEVTKMAFLISSQFELIFPNNPYFVLLNSLLNLWCVVFLGSRISSACHGTNESIRSSRMKVSRRPSAWRRRPPLRVSSRRLRCCACLHHQH